MTIQELYDWALEENALNMMIEWGYLDSEPIGGAEVRNNSVILS